MGATNTHHRPLVSGIRIVSAKMLGSTLQSISRGTLTGLATRNSDGKKVLVTNLHVMIGGSSPMRPTGREEMYQESTRSANKKVGSLPAWDPDSPAWVPIVGGQDNIADVAMCVLDEGVDAEFTLHDHPNHSSRKIIEGVVEPTKSMRLTMLGAANGEGTVTVKEVNQTEDVDDRTFTGLTILDCSQRPALSGDSGSACLYQVRDGRYQMSCIVFARDPDLPDGREGWAFPASVAEREMGITFGNRAPAAAAGRDQTVDVGVTVTLDGSGSSDPDTGDTLTYSWEQPAGPSVTLSSPTVASPTFAAPSTATTLTFRLTVSDGEASDIDAVTIRVIQTTAEEAVTKYDANNNGLIERSELIKAIQDYLFHNKISRKEVQAVIARHNESVSPPAPENLKATSGNGQITLRWSNPDNASITRYEYRLKSGANAWGAWTAIPGSGPATVTYVITGLTNGTAYTAEACAVNARGDGQSAQVGPVTPSASNRRPTARAGEDQTVNAGTSVTLSGSGTDADGDSLTYSWAQLPGGASVDIENSTSASASFTAPSTASTLRFRLTVNDGRGGADTDDVTITVSRPTPPPETWGTWTDTGDTQGCGPTKRKGQSRTSNLGNTQTRWVNTPEAETWGPWTDTGRTQGSGAERVKEQSRTSNCGNTETRWVGDSDLH